MVGVEGGWPTVGTEARTWVPDPASRGPRADRMLGAYRSAIVPAIATATPPLSPATRDVIADAMDRVEALQRATTIDIGALTGALLRSESVASSKIEHLDVGQADVALAALGVDPRRGGAQARIAARAVANNIQAMTLAVSSDEPDGLTLDSILRIHRTLMANDQYEAAEAGRLRTVQNWIGGSDYSPRDALFVPPRPEHLGAGLGDLLAFCRRPDLPPVVLAAIAHAQFETLHPFTDGNGRTGRALVHLLWRHTGFAPTMVIPVSTALLADVDAYFAGLAAYRDGDVDAWVLQFALAAGRAAVAGRDLSAHLTSLHAQWRVDVRPRAGSAVSGMLDLALRSPVLDIHLVRQAIDTNIPSLYRSIDRLVEAGVLMEVTRQQRNRVWIASDVFDLLEQFEQTLGRRRTPHRT